MIKTLKEFIHGLLIRISYSRRAFIELTDKINRLASKVDYIGSKFEYRENIFDEVNSFVIEVDHLLKRKDIKNILELGSRDGQVSIHLSRYFPTANIYAFECNPEAIKTCKEKLKGHNQVRLVEKAVSDTTGAVDFYAVNLQKSPSKNLGGSSMFIFNHEYPNDDLYQEKISVESVKLGQWCADNKIGEVDMIWMDLQGSELRALKGLGELIKHVKVIYTEVEFKPVYKEQPLFDDLHQYLSELNFRLHRKMYLADEWWGNVMYVNNAFIT